MISSKKIQFVVILILSCFFMPLFAAEPNEPETELKFEISNRQQRWLTRGEVDFGRGPIKPTHVAEIFIKDYGNLPGSIGSGKYDEILETKIGKSVSARQKEFIETSSSYDRINQEYSDKPIDNVQFRLYAVSQEDAKKMAQAFIERLNERAQERIKHSKDVFQEYEQRLAQDKKELLEKESRLEEIEKEYKKIKESAYPLSSDTEAVDLAKKSIIEMDKMLNALEIELAGINERLKAIKNYRENPESARPEVSAKLDVMYVELVVELRGLEAKKAMTEDISALEQNFLRTFNERSNLLSRIRQLNQTVEERQIWMGGVTKELNNPSPRMQPPKIYQNTVTIYPVIVEN